MRSHRLLLTCAFTIVGMLASGCAKKKVAATPPAPPASQPAPQAAAPARSTPAPAARPAEPTRAAAQPSRLPDAATRQRIDELLAKIEDAYFDYNKHSLRPDAIQALQKDSTELRDIIKQYPDYVLTIEGHCDERGSAEYNMALGDARAKSAEEYLAQVGVPGSQMKVVSYGKEKQVCSEHDEACWQKNRRIHIVAAAR